MQSNGYFVQGWAAKEDKKTGEIKVDKNGDITSLQIMSADNATYSPASTTAGLYSGNIDDHDTNVTSDDGKTITLEFYDNKGYLYTGKFTLKDTGTDHLFSLQLTDILDSDGNSINQEITLPDGTKTNRLDHVTFGKTETETKKISEGYYLENGTDNTVSVWREANSPVYSEYTIKSTGEGSLDNLLKIDGFLDEVYPLPTKGDTYRDHYGDITSYNITKDYLTIVYNSEDAKISTDNSKTYTSVATTNENPYYYDRTTKFGYALPSSSDSSAYKLTGKLSDLNQGLIQNVFGISATDIDPTKYADYDYNFDPTTRVLTVSANKGPTPTTTPVDTAALGTSYDEYFKGTKGDTVSQLITKINNKTIKSPTGSDYLSSTYSYTEDGTLTIKGKYKAPATDVTGNFGVTATDDPELFALLSGGIDADLDTTKLNTAQLDDLKKAVVPALSDPFSFTRDTSSGEITVISGNYSETFDSGDLYDAITALMDADGTNTWTGAGNSTAISAAGQTDLQAKLDSYFAGMTNFKFKLSASSPVKFTVSYNDGTATRQTDILQATNPDLFNYLNTLEVSYSPTTLTNAQKEELYANLGLSETDITSAKFKYSAKSLTGTTGYNVNIVYDGDVEQEATVDTFHHVSDTHTADTTTYDYGTPSTVFRNKDKTTEGYVLTGGTDGKYTLDQIRTQFNNDNTMLEKFYADGTTFDGLKGDYATLDDSKFNVQFVGSRMIVTHEQKDDNKISNDYEATPDSTTGTVTYKTVNPTKIADNLPASGNIADLLSSATGKYKGILETIFGVSDDIARAYGGDGTYKIAEDLKNIELTTGTHTIMLEFDAANGSLVSANDNSVGYGLVNMIFDQDPKYGMEAFGYQKGDNDPAEMVAGHVTFDFSAVTNYNTSGSSTVKAVKGDKKSLNTGRAVGEMNGVNISTDGRIYATYSNGQTKLLGQIASAEFANASGLSKEGDNLYSSTLNSGEATIQDITTDGGYMNTGVLEMSNVDLSREFTEMITTQRGFQANSRIITVSDTLLEELTNLKR
jgi:flagellar hook protein FlgE